MERRDYRETYSVLTWSLAPFGIYGTVIEMSVSEQRYTVPCRECILALNTQA